MAEKSKTLAQRRAILLAIIGATPADSVALKAILNNGLLVTIKSWLDEILNIGIGGVDLLLHLLGSIAMLPVTKEMVTSSKLGKLVASVEKHPICVGGMNEVAIKDRVSKVKDEWSASVKRLKKANTSNSTPSSLKRSLDSDVAPNAASKKVKATESTRKSLSSYLSQVSGSTKEESAAEQARRRAEEREAALKERLSKQDRVSEEIIEVDLTTNDAESDSSSEKKKKIVKWADMEGGPLTVSHGHDSKNFSHGDGNWSEKRKKDRVNEKQLLEKAKKSMLDDEHDSLDTMVMMYSTGWHQPLRLSSDIENPPLQIDSKELNIQMRRVLSTLPSNYLSEADVPSNPNALTDVEQALDLASQSTSIPQMIPLFVPVPEPVSLPAPAPINIAPAPAPMMSSFAPPTLAPLSNVATAEFVQSLGLPPFLVGHNVQALQTLAASPGLLNAFLDINGNYDQARIVNLVQTLTASIPGAVSATPVPPPPSSQQFPATGNLLQPYGHQYGSILQTQQYQVPPPPPPQAPTFSAPGSLQTSSNSTDGNLHLSGYGPMTTIDMIIQLFSPYVKVEEVVPKNGFMFLNTSDPEGAKRAKEALTGVMVGGGPLRINPAVRRTKNNSTGNSEASSSSTSRPSIQPTTLPLDILGQVDYNSVRDDRGNAATRNLFVAGYGPGTTEQQLKDAFSQFCLVTGIVMKGSFSFVNTSEKKSAVQAREALRGVMVNGGALRINFAKESGRLGTTFDGKQGLQKSLGASHLSHYGSSY